jgi:hypothetical protein
MVIALQEIEATLQEFRELNDRGIEELIKMFQRKQEPLLVYIAAIVEREELNDHEYDLLITNVLLTWEVLRKKCRNFRKLKMQQLKHIDDRVFQSLDSSLDLTGHPQPALMEKIEITIKEAEPEVREDRKPLILHTLAHVVAALNDACPEC